MSMLVLSVAACYYPPPDSANAPTPVDGKAHVVSERWFLQYAVATNIAATPDQIWPILTDSAGYPSWNSTIVHIDGDIEKDGKIKLKAKIDQSRDFDLTVSRFEPPGAMEWSDGSKNFLGVRTFTLTAKPDGTTDFAMKEEFTGRMLPMIAGALPNFGPDFETFASDLKTEAEKRNPPAPPPAAEPPVAPPAP